MAKGPDMSEEEINDEALKKLKELPESMTSKKRRKAKLGEIHHKRLTAWLRLSRAARRKWVNVHHSWQHDFSNIRLFQRSLQKIEIRCGTAIVNVFLFVRWSFFLNLLIATLSFFLVLIPYFASNWDVVEGTILPGAKCSITNLTELKNKAWIDINDRVECCSKLYHELAMNSDEPTRQRRGSMTELIQLYVSPNKSIEESPFFYGYYINMHPGETYDLFAFSYVFVIVTSLGISLILMVRSVGHGITEMIMASEGEHNPYTNLIFAGWEHYTKDARSAVFKRKILCHEMLIALSNEKDTLEKVMRSKRQQVKLFLMRFLVNLVVFGLLGAAAVAIYSTSTWSLETQRTKEKDTAAQNKKRTTHEKQDAKKNVALYNFFVGFAPSILISVLNIIFPLVLSKIGKFERYSMHTATALVLYRSLVIRLMSVGVAAISLHKLKYCDLKDKRTCTTCEKPGDTKDGQRVPCWESIFADQLYKLLLADFLLKVCLTMLAEPFRLQLKRWFKNKIIQRIGTMKFSIVRHSLDIIYLQVICWIGMYFAPCIPILAVIYSYIVFYIKKFSLLHNCTQVPDTLKTMKTTTTFVGAKLLAFVVVCFTNVYVLGFMTPSNGCGPFRKYDSSWSAVTELVNTSKQASTVYQFVTSTAVTLPVTLVLLLVGYYLYSMAQANRGMVETLRHLLILEGHDKQYLFARLDALRRGSTAKTTKNANRATLEALNIKLQEHQAAAPPTQEDWQKHVVKKKELNE